MKMKGLQGNLKVSLSMWYKSWYEIKSWYEMWQNVCMEGRKGRAWVVVWQGICGRRHDKKEHSCKKIFIVNVVQILV